MRANNDLRYDEIARVLDMRKSTVKVMIDRGCSKLRTAFPIAREKGNLSTRQRRSRSKLTVLCGPLPPAVSHLAAMPGSHRHRPEQLPFRQWFG